MHYWWRIFHHHPVMSAAWVATYALWLVPEIVLSKKLRSASDSQRSDRGSLAVVITSLNVGVVLGFVTAAIFPRFFAGEAHWQVLFCAGIAVWLSGIALRLYSIRVLGQFFTYDVATAKGQYVVRRGPYRWIRHPSYLGGLLALIGFGMTLVNWVAMAIPACCLIAGYAYRIPIEEQTLVRGLGDEYRAYMRQTWRLIPFVF